MGAFEGPQQHPVTGVLQRGAAEAQVTHGGGGASVPEADRDPLTWLQRIERAELVARTTGTCS